jgi:hypothetical protein
MLRLGFRVGGLMLAAAFAACAGSESENTESAESTVTLDALPDAMTLELSWKQATLVPASSESIADGPSAVAALPNGEVLVLDQLGERVQLLSYQKAPRTLTSIGRDARDLVAGADGGFVAFSPMRAKAWYFDAAGKSAGELNVPRELRELNGLALGTSRRLTVKTGYQELYTIGSPSAPVALPSLLAGKREGAAILPSGEGVAMQASKTELKLVVLSQATAETRSDVVRSFVLPHAANAGRVVGNDGNRVCVRTERVTSTPAIDVERRAVCLDATTGEILLDHGLPSVGVYLPRTELSMGGGRLVSLHPTPEGLHVTSSRIGGKGVH